MKHTISTAPVLFSFPRKPCLPRCRPRKDINSSYLLLQTFDFFVVLISKLLLFGFCFTWQTFQFFFHLAAHFLVALLSKTEPWLTTVCRNTALNKWVTVDFGRKSSHTVAYCFTCSSFFVFLFSSIDLFRELTLATSSVFVAWRSNIFLVISTFWTSTAFYRIKTFY